MTSTYKKSVSFANVNSVRSAANLAPLHELHKRTSQALPGVRVGDVSTYPSGFGNGKNVPRGQNEWNVGDIFWGPFLAPNLDPNVMSDSPSLALTRSAGPICAKERPYIAIGKLDGLGVVALPMFTSGSNGPPSNPITKQECIWIVGYNDPEPRKDGTIDDFALRPSNNSWSPKTNSYIRVSDISLVNYAYPIRHIARLSKESLEIARKWNRIFIDKSFEAISDQPAFINRIYRKAAEAKAAKRASAPGAPWAASSGGQQTRGPVEPVRPNPRTAADRALRPAETHRPAAPGAGQGSTRRPSISGGAPASGISGQWRRV